MATKHLFETGAFGDEEECTRAIQWISMEN